MSTGKGTDGQTGDTGGDGTGDDAPITMGTIRAMIAEAVGKKDADTGVRRAGRSAVNSRLDRDTEIADAVESAVKQLKEDEDRRAKEAGLHETIKELKSKVDTPPKEYRKITRIMFGTDD